MSNTVQCTKCKQSIDSRGIKRHEEKCKGRKDNK